MQTGYIRLLSLEHLAWFALETREDGRPVVEPFARGQSSRKVQAATASCNATRELGNASDQSWGSVQHGCAIPRRCPTTRRMHETTNTNKISMILDSDCCRQGGPKAVTSTNSEDAKVGRRKKRLN